MDFEFEIKGDVGREGEGACAVRICFFAKRETGRSNIWFPIWSLSYDVVKYVRHTPDSSSYFLFVNEDMKDKVFFFPSPFSREIGKGEK